MAGFYMVRKPMASDMKGQMAVGGELNPLEGRRMVNKLEDLKEAPAGNSLSCTQTERIPPNCLLPRVCCSLSAT